MTHYLCIGGPLDGQRRDDCNGRCWFRVNVTDRAAYLPPPSVASDCDPPKTVPLSFHTITYVKHELGGYYVWVPEDQTIAQTLRRLIEGYASSMRAGAMPRREDAARCRKCRQPFVCDEDDDEYGTGLCYWCFEGGVEEHEERRRQRIAEQNEYYPRQKGTNVKKIVILSLALCLAGCGEYSGGERVGTIQKFSSKGFVWKTWEGEMLLGGLVRRDSVDSDGSLHSSVAANVWHFTVEDPAMIAKVNDALDQGTAVRVGYRQEIATSPTRSAGLLGAYFVTSVKPAGVKR